MEGKFRVPVSILFPPLTKKRYCYTRVGKPTSVDGDLETAANLMLLNQAPLLIRGIPKGKFEIYGNLESKRYGVIKGLAPVSFYRVMNQIPDRTREKASIKKLPINTVP